MSPIALLQALKTLMLPMISQGAYSPWVLLPHRRLPTSLAIPSLEVLRYSLALEKKVPLPKPAMSWLAMENLKPILPSGYWPMQQCVTNIILTLVIPLTISSPHVWNSCPMWIYEQLPPLASARLLSTSCIIPISTPCRSMGYYKKLVLSTISPVPQNSLV